MLKLTSSEGHKAEHLTDHILKQTCYSARNSIAVVGPVPSLENGGGQRPCKAGMYVAYKFF